MKPFTIGSNTSNVPEFCRPKHIAALFSLFVAYLHMSMVEKLKELQNIGVETVQDISSDLRTTPEGLSFYEIIQPGEIANKMDYGLDAEITFYLSISRNAPDQDDEDLGRYKVDIKKSINTIIGTGSGVFANANTFDEVAAIAERLCCSEANLTGKSLLSVLTA